MSQIRGSGPPPRVSGASYTRDQLEKEKIYRKTKHGAPEQHGEDRKSPGHEGPAVAVSPSMLHGAVGDIIAGFISGPGADGHLILENEMASFSIVSILNLIPGQLVKVEIVKIDREIDAILLQADDLILETPLALKLSPISLHSGTSDIPAHPTDEVAPPYGSSIDPTAHE